MIAKDLSVIIPARNEFFLKQTVENVLSNIEADTEVIAICDGYWPDPPLQDHPRLRVIHETVPVGQRAATNEAARLSTAKFIMKLDGHCAVDKGFDKKLMKGCRYNWTIVPRLYNLHGFNWRCSSCGYISYQGEVLGELKGLQTIECPECHRVCTHEMEVVWKPRLNKKSDFARFDRDLHFQYWSAYNSRPEAKGDICDLMCHVGAGWFMHRAFFNDMEMLDEKHGSWGQMGVEISLKTWLIGGRQVVSKRTWYSHMFRTKGRKFGFPYQISGSEQESARRYSRDLWMNDKWSKATRSLRWVIDKFNPPGWEDFTSTNFEQHAESSELQCNEEI